MKNILKKDKHLPLYLRYSKFFKSSKNSIVCILNSDLYQTDQYNKKQFYKPIFF